MKEKTEKKSVSFYVKWTAIIVGLVGVGFVIGNENARGKVVGGVKSAGSWIKGKASSKPQPEVEEENPVDEEPEVETAPAQEEEAPRNDNNNRQERRGEYRRERNRGNYGYNRGNNN